MQMICGRLVYIRLLPSAPLSRQDAQSRCIPSLCLLPQPCPARSVALRRDASCCPFFPRIFFLMTAPTRLARLFIKTSKLTGFNRVYFTLFVTSVYYLLRRPISATSFRFLILSHKSRPPKTSPPALHSRLYAFIRFSFILSPLHILLFFLLCRLHHPPSIVQPLVT